MKYDLQKHKLLSILVGQTLKFDSDELPNNEPMGVSFDEILSKMRCNMIKLNLIAAELYLNKEIGYHDAYETKGLYCDKNGTIAYSKNKYRNRYWKKFWKRVLTANQIIIPLASFVFATIVTLNSNRQEQLMQTNLTTLQSEVENLKTTLESQTQEIRSIREAIFLTDSLSSKIK